MWNRLIPWMKINGEYKILRTNLIDPRLIKHLAFVAEIGKSGWKLLESERS